MRTNFFYKEGFTLVETLVGTSLFLIVAFSVYGAFQKTFEGLEVLKVKNTAIEIVNEQIEIAKNMSFADIGIVDGIPSGKILREKNETRNGINFKILATVRDIDDPFDGLITDVANKDTSPADYKLLEIQVDCSDCKYTVPMVVTARIAPKNLENTGNNGALFVQVVDAGGQPVQGADVKIQRVATTTTTVVNDTTNNDGILQLVNVSPGTNAYSVNVSKNGYSTEKSYMPGDSANPLPNTPHANVVSGLLTQITFAIDKVSDFTLETKDINCNTILNVPFNIRGSKKIGYDIYKFDQDKTTNSLGNYNFPNLEWDDYYINVNSSSYDLAGTSPLLPFSIQPDSTVKADIILASSNPNSVLFIIKDAGSGLPISDAEVTFGNTTKITGNGYFRQNNWSGGGGQSDYGDFTKYFSIDGGISPSYDTGEIKLLKSGSNYLSSGELTSSVFDTGSASNFGVINWLPGDQSVETGSNPVRVQIATSNTNTATTTWSFSGPDGSNETYFSSPNETINAAQNGKRYLRYKIFLSTEDTLFTPVVSDFSITYSSGCEPPGQVLFQGLSSASKTLTVSKDGYQTFNSTFGASQAWQSHEVLLTP